MWLFEEGWHEDILCCKHTHTCTERRNMPLCLRSKHRISHEGPRFSGGKSASCRLAHRLEHSLSPAFQWWGRLVARDPPPCVLPNGLPYRNRMMPGTMAEDFELSPWGRGRGHRHLGTGHNGRSTSDEMAMDAMPRRQEIAVSPSCAWKKSWNGR